MTTWLLRRQKVDAVRQRADLIQQHMDRIKQRAEIVLQLVYNASHTMLRLSLAVVFILFGALKIAGHSPVAGLLEATFPWANHTMLMVGLGSVEVLLGIALLVRKLAPLALLMAAGHLCGTFVTFLLVPGLMVQHGNPLLLTESGEFVAKNVVLISAAILLASTMLRPNLEPQPITEQS